MTEDKDKKPDSGKPDSGKPDKLVGVVENATIKKYKEKFDRLGKMRDDPNYNPHEDD
jgi:hypothetical protein